MSHQLLIAGNSSSGLFIMLAKTGQTGGLSYPSCTRVNTSGFSAALTGSTLTPAVYNGYPITQLSRYQSYYADTVDSFSCQIFEESLTLKMTGSPVQSIFTTMRVGGAAFDSALATYTLVSGTATWVWPPGANFIANTSYPVTFT